MSKTLDYAVVGSNVSYSLSPQIHSLFAKELDIPMNYGLMSIPEEKDFDKTLKDFFSSGGQGVNVTMPYKVNAANFAGSCSRVVAQTGSANTLKLEDDNTISACTTDGAGLIRDLSNRHAFDMQEKSILVIGAGGASAAILPSLIAKKTYTVSNCKPHQTKS